jgi:hypothetical protein
VIFIAWSSLTHIQPQARSPSNFSRAETVVPIGAALVVAVSVTVKAVVAVVDVTVVVLVVAGMVVLSVVVTVVPVQPTILRNKDKIKARMKHLFI